MLIKSRPRPLGPNCEFSYPNVFYMAQKSSKRPISAPVALSGRRLFPPRKPVCAIRKPKRVLQGSKPEAKITSKFHERCYPHWVPAPGLTSKGTRSKKVESRRQSYPLCLVCEYDHDCKDDESIQELYQRFQKGAFQ
jgi:hypothetical protein